MKFTQFDYPLCDKLSRISPIVVGSVDGNRPDIVGGYISAQNKGLLVLSEDSMVDPERIDMCDEGKVGPQAVNLSSFQGNPKVLNLIDRMLKKNAMFMPGTLLRDFGGYVLPVMPIISDGKIIQERVKLTGIPIVDDWVRLGENYFGKYYSIKMRLPGQGIDESMRQEVQSRLEGDVRKLRAEALRPLEFKGVSILPIICNECSIVENTYQNKPVDVVVHVADSLFRDDNRRIEAYQNLMRKLDTLELIRKTGYVIAAEHQDEKSFEGIFKYEKGVLETLNRKV